MSEGEIGNACPGHIITYDDANGSELGAHESAGCVTFVSPTQQDNVLVGCVPADELGPPHRQRMHVCKHCGAVYWVGS